MMKTKNSRKRAGTQEPEQSKPSAETEKEAKIIHAEGETYLLLSVPGASLPDQPDPFASLTAAEREVVVLLFEGLGNREISERRGTSPRTVANQIAVIYRKLGVRSRGELLAGMSPLVPALRGLCPVLEIAPVADP